jgi:hypothetical protein
MLFLGEQIQGKILVQAFIMLAMGSGGIKLSLKKKI